ncbi:MAG: hypothetical protein IPP11_09170 [Chitinophagaceae bacterium]|nr:hypothetical protein [Chitinophagaceae bacterium]
MLSLEACKKFLGKDGVKYTDDEIKKIRHLLYKLGELDYQLYKAQKNKGDANSNHLHKGIN